MLLLIANDKPLGFEWRDHQLKWNWNGYRECHVGGDFLLIYRLDGIAGKSGTIIFVQTGTHSEFFGSELQVAAEQISSRFGGADRVTGAEQGRVILLPTTEKDGSEPN